MRQSSSQRTFTSMIDLRTTLDAGGLFGLSSRSGMQRHSSKTAGKHHQLRKIGQRLALSVRHQTPGHRRPDAKWDHRRRRRQLFETEHLRKAMGPTRGWIDADGRFARPDDPSPGSPNHGAAPGSLAPGDSRTRHGIGWPFLRPSEPLPEKMVRTPAAEAPQPPAPNRLRATSASTSSVTAAGSTGRLIGTHGPQLAIDHRSSDLRQTGSGPRPPHRAEPGAGSSHRLTPDRAPSQGRRGVRPKPPAEAVLRLTSATNQIEPSLFVSAPLTPWA